mgnify:CR=1 FL=1
MNRRIILKMIFVSLAFTSQAQKDNIFVPPNIPQKSYSFELNKLLIIDSVFIEGIDSVLFSKNCHYAELEDFKFWHDFHITFVKQDSSIYLVFIELWNFPLKKALGFLERNEYFYFLSGDIPPNIIFMSKSKRKFFYKNYFPYTIDPPLWILIYNIQSRKIKIKELYCY